MQHPERVVVVIFYNFSGLLVIYTHLTPSRFGTLYHFVLSWLDNAILTFYKKTNHLKLEY
ncbi:hypothetical protein EGI05_00335 [Chryseobacterium daecheongense]|uniref:Uncharacterized protein n=1 Tax=Chryseobacterium daecheongense TaxID=192389 RepID=A0A3N0W3K7_9FLAO|nr:hypothetical protein EGI05_00335 [Chryseobacterium daecheongense]